MVLYKSCCREVKTFHGETFHFGETKAVNGYIHDPRFICLGPAPTNVAQASSASVPSQVVSPKPKIEYDKKQPKTAKIVTKAKSETATDGAKPSPTKSSSSSTTAENKKEQGTKVDSKKAEAKKAEAKKVETKKFESTEKPLSSTKKDG